MNKALKIFLIVFAVLFVTTLLWGIGFDIASDINGISFYEQHRRVFGSASDFGQWWQQWSNTPTAVLPTLLS